MNGATAGSAVSNKCRKTAWACSNPFPLTCMGHGEEIAVRCGRWRTCPGCSAWKQWTLRQRFLAGIEKVPDDKLAMFVTLTFPASEAPNEDEAHKALRSLVGRLRYRDQLGAYSWVLQRTKRGVLHHHGIWHMPWQDDDLAMWRDLIVKSGFGIQNRLVVAQHKHARYCARYISTRMAALAPLRRAYGFSPDFPLTDYDEERALLRIDLREEHDERSFEPPDPDLLAELRDLAGIEREWDACAWTPTATLYR